MRQRSSSHGSRTSTTSGAARARSARQRSELGGDELRDQNSNRAGAAALTSGATTVSNRSVVTRAPGAVQRDEPRRHRRRFADDREHAAAGLQLLRGTLSGSTGVEPVSTIAS